MQKDTDYMRFSSTSYLSKNPNKTSGFLSAFLIIPIYFYNLKTAEFDKIKQLLKKKSFLIDDIGL